MSPLAHAAPGPLHGALHDASLVQPDSSADPILPAWSDEHEDVLRQLAADSTFFVPWPLLRQICKTKLRLNTRELLELMPAAAGSVDGEQQAEGKGSEEGGAMVVDDTPSPKAAAVATPTSAPTVVAAEPPASALAPLSAVLPPVAPSSSTSSASGAALNDATSPALPPPPADEPVAAARLDPGSIIGGRRLPAALTEDEADVLMGRIDKLLDDFDAPPFTIQRAAELLSTPLAHHVSGGKYLRALLRVLDVHSHWTAPTGTISVASGAAAGGTAGAGDSAPSPQAGEGAGWATPLFSPIPFLKRDNSDTAADAAPPMSPMTLGSPLAVRPSPHSPQPRTAPLPLVGALDDGAQFSPPAPSGRATDAPPHLLSSDELIVDELDGGLANPPPPPSSAVEHSLAHASPSEPLTGSASEGSSVPPEGQSTAPQGVHLLSPTPHAFTSTTTTAVSPSTTSPARGAPRTPPSARVRPREADGGPTGEEGEAQDRFAREKSPTPDAKRLLVTGLAGSTAASASDASEEDHGGSA